MGTWPGKVDSPLHLVPGCHRVNSFPLLSLSSCCFILKASQLQTELTRNYEPDKPSLCFGCQGVLSQQQKSDWCTWDQSVFEEHWIQKISIETSMTPCTPKRKEMWWSWNNQARRTIPGTRRGLSDVLESSLFSQNYVLGCWGLTPLFFCISCLIVSYINDNSACKHYASTSLLYPSLRNVV